MKDVRLVVIGVALLVTLGACERYFSEEYFNANADRVRSWVEPRVVMGPGFGDTTQHNWAVQVVDPEPELATGPLPMDGQRAAGAMERYRTGKVIQPEEILTTGGVSK